MSEVFRVVVDDSVEDAPVEYDRLDGKLFRSVEAASEAVRAAWRAVRAQIPEEAGATCGPTYEREFFSRDVYFPPVRVVKESVE